MQRPLSILRQLCFVGLVFAMSCGEQDAVNCYDEIGDVNNDGALTAADCLEAVGRNGEEGALQCQTVRTPEFSDGVHVLSCPADTTLVSASCSGMDRYAYPVVPAEEGDPPNTARCRCNTQCDHTKLMIRCCAYAP
jgi:hypothetical protein